MTEAPNHVVDAVVQDAVESQRARGLIPRTTEVRAYVQGVVERMERRESEDRLRVFSKPAATPRPRVERSTEAMEEEFRRRLRRRGQEPVPGQSSWTIERKPIEDIGTLREARLATPDTPKIVDKRMALAKRRMRKRLRLLRSKPEWEARLKTINPLALQGFLGPDKQKHATALVKEILDDSARVFGPWWKGPAKKLMFT